MRREVACFAIGVAVGSASLALGAQHEATSRKLILGQGDEVVMPELRWDCFYFLNGPGRVSGAPPGPEFHCGRLGAMAGGIRTHVDVHYVVVSRGPNFRPRILLKARRP